MLALALLIAAQADVVPPTRLIYLPGPFAGACPTDVELQEAVARRIGRSPFAEPAERIVVVALEGSPSADRPARAKTELFDGDFTSLGARTLDSGEGCRELVEAVALSISIALAPSLALAPEPKPVAPPEPAPITPPTEPLAPEQPPAVATEAPAASVLPPGVVLLVGIGGDASLLLAPDAAAGAHLSVAVRAGDIELRLEERQHVPEWSSSLVIVHGAAVLTGAGCGHLPLFAVVGDGDEFGAVGCATGSLGTLWALGAYIGGSPYAGAGARVGLEWVQKNRAAWRASGQVEWSIVRPSFFAFNGTAPWSQDAPVNVTLGLSYEFPLPF